MSIASTWNPMGTAAGGGGVPPEYEPRLYLESWYSDGNAARQMIDTGRKPTLETRWEVKIRVLDSLWGQFNMGCYSGSTSNKMFVITHLSQKRPMKLVACQGTSYDRSEVWSGAVEGTDLVCALDNANGYVEIGNGGTAAGDYGRRYIGSDTVSPPNENIALFSRGALGNSSLMSQSVRIYWSRIYEGGVLVQDLAPCVRKSDRVRGFYDLVTGGFLVNSCPEPQNVFHTDDDSDL